MTEPLATSPPPRSHWRPIGITLLSTLVIAFTFCAGGATLDGKNVGALAGLLMVIGLLSTVVFFVTLLVAFVLFLVGLFSRSGKPS